MQITLNNGEIEEAIVDFIDKQGIALSDTDVTVQLMAGRGVNGYSATVNIEKRADADTNVTALVEDSVDTPVEVKPTTSLSKLTALAEMKDEDSTEEPESKTSLFGG